MSDLCGVAGWPDRARWSEAMIKVCAGCKKSLSDSRSTFCRKCWNDSPERKAISSATSINSWANPEIREKMILGIKQSLNKPETKIRKSAIAIDKWNNPEIRERMILGIIKAYSSDRRDKQANDTRKTWTNPLIRKKRIEGQVKTKNKQRADIQILKEMGIEL